MAASAVVACPAGQVGRLGDQEGKDNCSRDQARWAGKPDQVETIPGAGIPCQIHQGQEDQDQVGPSLVEAGKEGTCWGFENQVRQVRLGAREDHWDQEVGWLQVLVLGAREPRG